jgi:hypothetical protein
MADHVPFVDVMFQTNLLNLSGEHFQLLWAVWDLGSSPQARQVDSEASEPVAEPVNNAAPKPAAGRHAVDEQYGISRSASQ